MALDQTKNMLRGLPAISPMALVLAFRRPKALRGFLSDAVRAYRRHGGRRLPAIDPARLLDRTEPVNIRTGEYGWFPSDEANLLVMHLVATLQPRTIFEIGTHHGTTCLLMAMNAPEDAKIYTLDLPPEESMPEGASDAHLIEKSKTELGAHFRETRYYGTKIQQLLGNTKTFDFVPYHDAMDLVLVDASHTYEFVFNDSMHAFRMVQVGGVVLWHDYESMRSEYGVTRFVDRLRYRHGCPTYRLSSPNGDTRYAVMRVDAATKEKLVALANRPQDF